jgi:hypothetical protein
MIWVGMRGTFMSTASTSDSSDFKESMNRCRKLARFLTAGRITFEDYAYNVSLTIVRSPIDGIPQCVDTVPHEIVASYAEYLRGFLEPVDFMPCPKPFLAGIVSEEVFERTKREYRDRYLRLYEVMMERASSLQS